MKKGYENTSVEKIERDTINDHTQISKETRQTTEDCSKI